MTYKLAVVILNWNGQTLLQQFLPGVITHSANAQIYIADNASTDTSKAYVETHFPQVNWIQLEQNYGYAGGYNRALTQVKEPYLCLLNSDIEVTEKWLDPVITLFESQPQTAIIQPKILDYHKKTHFEYAGAAGGFIDRYGFPFCRGRIFDTIEEDRGQYDDTSQIFWASGACFFIRNEVFRALDGFDEDFFAHQEEIDLCWRAFNKNLESWYCGSSEVYHVGGSTLQYGSPQKTFLNYRNSLLMMYKNLPNKNRFSTLFARLCLDGLSGVRLLAKGNFKHCWAIVRSHFSFYKKLRHFRSKKEKSTKTDYFKIKNVVFLYFIKNKKKYIDLFNE